MSFEFNAETITARLETRALGRTLRFLESTSSTSTVAMQLGHEGAPHGTVVVAETQTQGRGRMGRSWVSPAGKNLYLSLLLRPDLPPTRAPELTLLAAVATQDALAACGVDPKVKWPNDIELNGLKAVGILCEMSADEWGLRHVVIGIGVDVNMLPEDFPPEIASIATSLRCVTGKETDRASLLAHLLERFEYWLERHAAEGFEPIRQRWLATTSLLGCRVRARLTQGELVGTAEGLDHDGALLVRNDRNELERVVVGDIERLARPVR